MKTKKCSKCNTKKSFDEFSNRKQSKDGKVTWCKACFKEYRKINKEKFSERDKLYYNENKEKILNRVNKYRIENNEVIKERKKKDYKKHREKNLVKKEKYYQDNKETILENMKLYQAENKERYTKYKRNYAQKNRETEAERSRKYIQENPEKYREYKARRRALERKNAVGKVDYQKILRRDGMFCYICQKSIEDGNYHMDHVIPLSKGGSHSMENIKVTHARCNLVKNDKSLEEARKLLAEEEAIRIVLEG